MRHVVFAFAALVSVLFMTGAAHAQSKLPTILGPNGYVTADPVAVIGYDSVTLAPCVVGSAATCRASATGGTASPLGCSQITSLSASTALTVPTGSTMVSIVPEAQAVRWRDDGTAPTATVGMPLQVNQPLFYAGSLAAIRFIEVTASAKINACFYR